MFDAVDSPYLVPFDGTFDLGAAPSEPPKDQRGTSENKARLAESRRALVELQRKLYADDRWAVLLVFQAMDAAGKDSTIRHVLSGVNPAGCQVYSFKKPSTEELDHDFLWRTAQRLPERGRIGVFNRSYYEEVLVVRVHPDLLQFQRLPEVVQGEELWTQRLAAIRHHEHHLALSGTVVLKFWLNISREQQRRRFLRRLTRPDKHWKFEPGDVAERRHWDAYMQAYAAALNATSRSWAPWYAIPADDKPFMRACVADIIVRSLQTLGVAYPAVEPGRRAALETLREQLEREGHS